MIRWQMAFEKTKGKLHLNHQVILYSRFCKNLPNKTFSSTLSTHRWLKPPKNRRVGRRLTFFAELHEHATQAAGSVLRSRNLVIASMKRSKYASRAQIHPCHALPYSWITNLGAERYKCSATCRDYSSNLESTTFS